MACSPLFSSWQDLSPFLWSDPVFHYSFIWIFGHLYLMLFIVIFVSNELWIFFSSHFLLEETPIFSYRELRTGLVRHFPQLPNLFIVIFSLSLFFIYIFVNIFCGLFCIDFCCWIKAVFDVLSLKRLRLIYMFNPYPLLISIKSNNVYDMLNNWILQFREGTGIYSMNS